jgi:PIN domain nuclease of toxin-antitoxin system
MVSFWAVSIKHRIGKIDERGSEMMVEVVGSGFRILDIGPDHLALVERLEAKPGHRDPFDHLILAQARAEDAILVTSDRQLRASDVPCL